jgi:hypothetical protein
MNFVDHYLLYFRQLLIIPHPHPAVGPSAFPAFVYRKFQWRSASCLSHVLQCAYSTPLPLLCVSLHFLVYSVFFVCVGVGGQSAQGLCWFFPGVAGEYCMMLGAHLLVCRMSLK